MSSNKSLVSRVSLVLGYGWGVSDDTWMPSMSTRSTRRHLMLGIGEAILDEAGMSKPTIEKILGLVKQNADARSRR